MLGTKKTIYPFVIVLIALAAFFYLRQDAGRVSLDFLQGRERQIGSYLSCSGSPLFEKELLALRKKPSDPVRIFIHFTERPQGPVKDFFEAEGIVLHLDTWVLDYAAADTQVHRLCFLTTLAGITGISSAEL